MQNCLPFLICIGLFVVGFVCCGLSVGMGLKLEQLNEATTIHFGSGGSDKCNPGLGDKAYAEYGLFWWIQACPGTYATREESEDSLTNTKSYRYYFGRESFWAICTCNQARMAAIVLMAITGFAQLVVSIVFGCISSPGSCCQPRRKWAVFSGFVVVFLFFSFISFVLALHFGIYETNKDGDLELSAEKYDLGLNRIGIAFTAFCGIDAILNLMAAIITFVGLAGANKNDDPTTALQEEIAESSDDEDQDGGQGQVEGQDQGQGSQDGNSDPANPPTHSKSQNNTQANVNGIVQSQKSVQISNTQS